MVWELPGFLTVRLNILVTDDEWTIVNNKSPPVGRGELTVRLRIQQENIDSDVYSTPTHTPCMHYTHASVIAIGAIGDNDDHTHRQC